MRSIRPVDAIEDEAKTLGYIGEGLWSSFFFRLRIQVFHVRCSP